MVKFYVVCQTSFGQDLFLSVGETIVPMRYVVNGLWHCESDIASKSPTVYRYYVQNPDKSVIEESPVERLLPAFVGNLTVHDTFQAKNISYVFRTTPFVESLCFHKAKKLPKLSKLDSLLLVNAPAVESHQGVAVVGSHPLLGEWNASQLVEMQYTDNANWFVVLKSDETLQGAEYKFVVYDLNTHAIVRWEEGENRRLPEMAVSTMLTQVFRQTFQWKGAGVAIPVFSLRSENDWGVGEFYDLKEMVDWAEQTGQKLIQILPINDTTNTKTDADSYPYSTNSVYALHPMYLNMKGLGVLKDKKQFAKFEQEGQLLNAKSFVDYAAVNHLKWNYLMAIFAQESSTVFATQAYQNFFKTNESWLVSYAVFSALRDEFGTSDFRQWPRFSTYDEKAVKAFADKHFDAISIYYFVQYHLARQLSEVRDYAHAKGVVFKGDLPIGISPNSVDAWMYPRLFHLDKQAGAPPDDFSVTGQNWGFPTYNWEEMAKDGFSWWKNRFQNMAHYFDAYRIDHILGFFRIWEIPKSSVWGLLGYFNPALPLSVAEIEAYGIRFDADRLLTPYITEALLTELFGEQKESVISHFLDIKSAGVYQFKPLFDTQQKVQHYFDTHDVTSEEKLLLNGLLELHTEVLFVEDVYHKNSYHPRITIQKSHVFKSLDDAFKNKLNRLYEDYYYYRHTEFWKKQAMAKLPELLRTTNMLVCGEDLGMVPACVPAVMEALQILSLEIQRMPKNPATEFVLPSETPYLSVCSTGTHDTSPLRSWWLENPESIQRYYTSVLRNKGVAPTECTTDLAEQIISQQLQANGMWVILPLQDYLAMDGTLRLANPLAERINDPSNPHHFWSYRMHLTLSELKQASDFNHKLYKLVAAYRH